MDEKIDILIVDDRKENLLVLENLLQSDEINILKASSGEEALMLTFEYNFAVVFLDVEMPGMNGFETAELMRAREQTRNVPIIFLTAHKEENYIFKGYESGAVDFLSKPIEPKILNNKIKVFIEIFKQNKKLKEQSILLEKSIKEMKVAREEAVIANKMKSQFIANTSHELRTPLNAIIGISKMLTKYNAENLIAEQIEGLDVINKSGNRLLALINDLLDLSKIEAGKMDVFLAPIYIDDTINQLRTMVISLIGSKDIKFVVEKEESFPKLIVCDEKKLIQVIINLLSNAVKFTEKGYIFFRLYRNNKKIFFEVEDTGIGIKGEDQAKLFNNFMQIDGSLSRKQSGTGLGLSLSKKIVELLNGEIKISSEFGKGTSINFNIPEIDLELIDDSVKKSRIIDGETYYVKDKKILIAEDEEFTVLTLKMMLRDKYEVLFAKNGIEAIEMCLREKPQLVLMDIMMPELNGIDALIEIRKKDATTPILAFTGLAMKEQVEKIMESGFDDYVVKPVEDDYLCEMIEKYARE